MSEADLLSAVRGMHEAIRDAVVEACEAQATDALAVVASDEPGDTIYAIDRISEELLIEHLSTVAERCPLVLMAEGLASEGLVLPRGTARADARYRVIVDPIDGTRGVMYQKRPAWILTGVAPERGAATLLRDIELAVQTEIPLIKQHACDTAWATRGGGAFAERLDRFTGTRTPLALRPSTADDIAHGFVNIARFFPGARDALAAVDEQMVETVLGPPPSGKALCFEDQYACTGGQLYELMTGHDRMVADLRPLTAGLLRRRGKAMGLCCHPYDLCTVLIAEEAGVIVTDERGEPLDAPLDLDSDVAWIGYANAAIRGRVEPALQRAMQDHGLWREPSEREEGAGQS